MNEFWNVENPFFKGISKVMDCVTLSILWLLCCIPLVTVGASSAALYYAVNKSVKNERGYAVNEFFRAFKVNFKQATVIWLILIGIYLILGFDYYVMKMYAQAGIAVGGLYIAFEGFAILAALWTIYIFPYLARFENTTKSILKNSAWMALRYLPKSILMLITFVFLLTAVYYVPLMLCVVPAVYQICKNLILEKIFRKYMTPEDIRLEEERNRIFYN